MLAIIKKITEIIGYILAQLMIFFVLLYFIGALVHFGAKTFHATNKLIANFLKAEFARNNEKVDYLAANSSDAAAEAAIDAAANATDVAADAAVENNSWLERKPLKPGEYVWAEPEPEN